MRSPTTTQPRRIRRTSTRSAARRTITAASRSSPVSPISATARRAPGSPRPETSQATVMPQPPATRAMRIRSSPIPRPRRRSEWGRAASGGSTCCAGSTSRRVGTGRVRIMRDTEASRSGPGRGTASTSPRCPSPGNPNRRHRSACPHPFEPRRLLQLPHEAAVRTVKAVPPRALTRNCATWREPDASGDRRHAWPRAAGARSVAPTDALAARRARRRSSALGFLRDAALEVSGRRRHEQPTQARRPHDLLIVCGLGAPLGWAQAATAVALTRRSVAISSSTSADAKRPSGPRGVMSVKGDS